MILLDTNVLIYASTHQSPFHAQIMGWPLATADAGRFRTYFPSVTLLTP
jgi:predicted nucleic acid-binding protein